MKVCSYLYYCPTHFDIPWLRLTLMTHVTVQMPDIRIYSSLTQGHTTYPLRANRLFPSSACKPRRVEFQVQNATKTTKAYSGLLGCDTMSLQEWFHGCLALPYSLHSQGSSRPTSFDIFTAVHLTLQDKHKMFQQNVGNCPSNNASSHPERRNPQWHDYKNPKTHTHTLQGLLHKQTGQDTTQHNTTGH